MINWPIEITENKYSRWYEQLITKARDRGSIDGYTEKHHIIPRSIGGNNTKENLAILTAREHFICHWLLFKFTTGTFKLKMALALSMMHRTKNDHMNRYKSVNFSRVYEKLKIFNSEFATINQTGRKYTAKAKANMSKAQKKCYREVWTDEMKAKRSAIVSAANRKRVFTDEMRLNRSKALTGIKRTPEFREMVSQRWKGKKRGPLTEERKQEISRKNKGAGNPKAKTWEVISPDGEIFVTTGELRSLCKTLPISVDSVRLLAYRKKDQIKGWKARLVK